MFKDNPSVIFAHLPINKAWARPSMNTNVNLASVRSNRRPEAIERLCLDPHQTDPAQISTPYEDDSSDARDFAGWHRKPRPLRGVGTRKFTSQHLSSVQVGRLVPRYSGRLHGFCRRRLRSTPSYHSPLRTSLAVAWLVSTRTQCPRGCTYCSVG
jgi:hypothetical protein